MVIKFLLLVGVRPLPIAEMMVMKVEVVDHSVETSQHLRYGSPVVCVQQVVRTQPPRQPRERRLGIGGQ